MLSLQNNSNGNDIFKYFVFQLMNVIQVLICLDLYLILFNKVLFLPTEVLMFLCHIYFEIVDISYLSNTFCTFFNNYVLNLVCSYMLSSP